MAKPDVCEVCERPVARGETQCEACLADGYDSLFGGDTRSVEEQLVEQMEDASDP